MPPSRQRQWGFQESIKLLTAINRCNGAGVTVAFVSCAPGTPAPGTAALLCGVMVHPHLTCFILRKENNGMVDIMDR
jgi:hypothetical protein